MTAAAGPTPFSSSNISGPALDGFVITPSNTVNFNTMARGIYVGGAGDIGLVTSQGTVLTFIGLTAGSILPIVCIRVNITNTTATSLIGLI